MPLEEPLTPALAIPSFAHGTEEHNRVLFGPLGLRAGWGILAFFLLTFLFGFALVIGLFTASGHATQYRREAQQSKLAIERAKAAHQEPSPQMLRGSTAALQEAGITAAYAIADHAGSVQLAISDAANQLTGLAEVTGDQLGNSGITRYR